VDYSRVEVAVDARHRVQSCDTSPRVPCNKADAVRSTRLNGKKMAIKIKNKNEKIVKIIILEKISYISENKLIIKTSPFFFMNSSG
jgi:hypothetical protein